MQTSQQASECRLLTEPKPEKTRQSHSKVKVMLTLFFDVRGDMHSELLPEGQTVNKIYYLSVKSSMALWSMRVIAEVKQRWSVIGWVTKNLLSRAPACFGRHIKPLVPAAFAVVSTHQPALGARAWGLFSLCAVHKAGLCPSSEDINRLMMII
jgi:hypothetical protein